MKKVSAREKIQICNEAINLKKEIERSFIELGKRLLEIKNNGLYEGQWQSWSEYCAELKLSENTTNKLIQIYQTFVLDYKFTPERISDAGGWSVIADLLPAIETKADAEEWLNKAAVLTREDLRKELTEKKTGIQMKDCPHKETYMVEICKCCGNKTEVHE